MSVRVRIPTKKGDETVLMEPQKLREMRDSHLLIGEKKVLKPDVRIDMVEKFAIQTQEELEEEIKKASEEGSTYSITAFRTPVGG